VSRITEWAGNGRQATVRVAVPEPIGAFQAGAVDVNNGLGLTPLSGSVRWGDSGTPLSGTRYAGDLGPLQDFRGGAFLGSAATARYRPNVALPSAAGPVAPNTVLDLLGTASRVGS